MKPQQARDSTVIKRLAWLAALLVVLRVFAWELHNAVAEHPIGETCQVCIAADRSDDALVATASVVQAATSDSATPRAPVSPPRAAAALRPPPRGPPSSRC